METNASNYAYGAILSQKGTIDLKYHPIAFYSRSMNPAKWNYGISDKEALAIVKALQHWQHLLEGTEIPIEIITDHKNLEYFSRPRILNRQQLRWQDLLTHYNYTITYQPGHRNSAADTLSRQEELAPTDTPEEEPWPLFMVMGEENAPDGPESKGYLFGQVAEIMDQTC